MRLIDADKLIKEGWILARHGESNRLLGVKSIADVPTVDAVPVVHGEWIEKPYLYGITRYCSVCNQNYGMPHGIFNFCPNCGADMRKGKENE